MPKAIECRPGAKDAVNAIASHPWSIGSPKTGIYFENRLTPKGRVVSFAAVHEEAAKLTGDPSIQFVGLERNPNMHGLENTTVLTVGRLSNGKYERSRAKFDEHGILTHAEGVVAMAQSGSIFAGIEAEFKGK